MEEGDTIIWAEYQLWGERGGGRKGKVSGGKIGGGGGGGGGGAWEGPMGQTLRSQEGAQSGASE